MKLRVVEGRNRRVVGYVLAADGMETRDGFHRRLTVESHQHGVRFLYDDGRPAPIFVPPVVELHVAKRYSFKGV